MIPNQLPAVKAFCAARIRTLNFAKDHPVTQAAIQELELVIQLCDGLEKQNEMLSSAFKHFEPKTDL